MTHAEPLLKELEAFVAACYGEPVPWRPDQGAAELETTLAVVEAIKA